MKSLIKLQENAAPIGGGHSIAATTTSEAYFQTSLLTRNQSVGEYSYRYGANWSLSKQDHTKLRRGSAICVQCIHPKIEHYPVLPNTRIDTILSFLFKPPITAKLTRDRNTLLALGTSFYQSI